MTFDALRTAGVDAHVDRIMGEVEASICRTRRGRFAWTLARRYVKWATRRCAEGS